MPWTWRLVTLCLVLSRSVRSQKERTCPSGQYTKEEGLASRCAACPKGKYAYLYTTAETTCDKCPMGYTTDNPGLDQCYTCGAGRVAIHPGHCSNCVEGKYSEGSTAKNVTQPQHCKVCPVGRVTRTVAATSESDCAPFAIGKCQNILRADCHCRRSRVQCSGGWTQETMRRENWDAY